MTTYQELQKKYKHLNSNISGSVVLGVDDLKNLVVLNADQNGTLFVSSLYSDKVLFGGVLNLPPLSKETILSHEFLENSICFSFLLSGNGLGELTIKKNGAIISIIRNSYFEQTKIFNLVHPFLKNDKIECEVKNESFTNQNNTYECFIYYKEFLE